MLNVYLQVYVDIGSVSVFTCDVFQESPIAMYQKGIGLMMGLRKLMLKTVGRQDTTFALVRMIR